MRIVAIIQARMGSTRLPGKVLKTLADKTVLEHVIERVKAVSQIDEVIVATTVSASDDLIVEEAIRLKTTCFRGSEADVLSRFYEAALHYDAEAIVRITSDCPLIDPAVVNAVINKFIENRADYASNNSLERSFPRGLDVEVFTMAALTEAFKFGIKPEQREHVTSYIYQNHNTFKLVSHNSDVDYSKYRWTLDTIEDWELLQEIFHRLYSKEGFIRWKEIIKLMEENPELPLINIHIEQKKLGG